MKIFENGIFKKFYHHLIFVKFNFRSFYLSILLGDEFLVIELRIKLYKKNFMIILLIF